MKSAIVVDGAKRRLDSDYARKRRKELNEHFLQEFSDELCEANFLKRMQIKRRIKEKVNQAIRDEFDQGLQNLNLKVKL